MHKSKSIGAKIPVAALAAAAGLVFLLLPSSTNSASATWTGTEGCTPGYWKNHADTNPRVAQLYGINLNAAILDITGLNLGAPANLTIDKAVAMKGGGNNALYRAAGAAVFNYYYADPNQGDSILYIEPSLFTSYIQQALNGDVSGAANNIDKANNLGCPIDSFGRWD